MQPYLSLNRQDVQLTLPRVDQEAQVRAEPFLGSRPSAWRPPVTTDIVVDDLDPGFSVESDEEQNGVRLAGGLSSYFLPPVDMDQGLPAANGFAGTPTEWSRREASASWGKYRHTMAVVRSGAGDRRAVFAAELPRAGRWRLALHLPEPTTRQGGGSPAPNVQINVSTGLGRPGTYDLTLIAGGEERALEFDAAAAETGWNTLGEFDLPRGAARLLLSNRSSGRAVIADAVRWQPLDDDR